MKKIANIFPVLIAAMALLGLSGCAREELSMPDTVEEGVPITVTLNLSGTSTSDIVVDTKASGSDLSELSDLVIFIFHKDGTFEDVVTNYHDYKSLTINSNEVGGDKCHLYNVTFNTTSGTKKLLAVANVAEGGYWDKVIDILTVAYQKKASFDEVKSEIVSLREDLTNGIQPFHITSSSQMFISGWNEGVVFGTDDDVTNYGTYGDGDKDVAIKMYRAMANITFNIAENPDGKQGTFTPASFRVYNIPTKSYLINDLQGQTYYSLTENVDGVEYINTAPENIGTAQEGSYTFDFYMPENVQPAGNNITGYADRDKWIVEENGTSVSGALPENKTWANAPQNSTFVVISGTYEGKATVDGRQDQDVTANVEYTIHLGDFSNTTGSIDNFSVERNVSYTYNVKVLGVDKIIVEAKREDGEYQSGAEGSVYDRENTQFSYNLDAHYEQVYLEYNLSNIANSLSIELTDADLDNAIANQLILIIQSPMMSYTHDETHDEPYTTRNNRGTLSPYKIYADAVRDKSAEEAEEAAAAAKSNVLGGAGSGATPTKGFDYKWIEFLPQKDPNTISRYPGISRWAMESLEDVNNKDFYANAYGNDDMLDVYDVIVEMGKAIKEIYLYGQKPASSNIQITQATGGDYLARFTAFVNEYYYLHHPLTSAKATSWSRMTNKMPREMIIAMSTETSTDGNSSYSKIHSYISQLSMQTFYNDQSESLNAFGMETYNETPLYYFGTPTITGTLTDDDGRVNQKKLMGASSSWSTYIRTSGNGWTQSVSTEHDSHKLTAAYAMESAYSACMSRNRDLNGNGTIDENEIRWFLASLNEYIRMGIGATAISNAAQLYIGDKTQLQNPTGGDKKTGYPYNVVSDGSLFYTSSDDSKRVYWAIEKGSYSSETANWYIDQKQPLPIRCIRNLPASGEGLSTDISSIDKVKSDATYEKHNASGNTPIVLEFKDRLVPSLYRQRVQGSLDIHNEDYDANKFYEGIFVASDYIHTTDWWGNKTYQQYYLGNIIGYTGSQGGHTYNGIMSNPCSSYTEGGYDNWRVPNLVELLAMNAAGLLTMNYTACCTQFTKMEIRYGFAYNLNIIYCPGGPDALGDINNEFYIRCVRDVPAGYTFPTN